MIRALWGVSSAAFWGTLAILWWYFVMPLQPPASIVKPPSFTAFAGYLIAPGQMIDAYCRYRDGDLEIIQRAIRLACSTGQGMWINFHRDLGYKCDTYSAAGGPIFNVPAACSVSIYNGYFDGMPDHRKAEATKAGAKRGAR